MSDAPASAGIVLSVVRRPCSMALGVLAGLFTLTLGGTSVEAAPRMAAVSLQPSAILNAGLAVVSHGQRGCVDCSVTVVAAEQDRGASTFPFDRTFSLGTIDGQDTSIAFSLEIIRRPDGRFRARGGIDCNELYGGVLLGDGGSIKLDLAQTMKECSGQSESEGLRIFEAFEKVERWRLESDTLILEGGGHVVRMKGL